jgi:hypothetical protein
MAVYVDPLRDYRSLRGDGPPGLWCHLVTDGDLQELHDFAMRIGLPRHRFQNHPRHPHYDLFASARMMAVDAGAVEVSTAQLARILRVFRPAAGSQD